MKLFRDGQMTFEQINTCYQSWYGYQAHFDAHKALRNMDKYFYSLFGKWPKHKKGSGRHGKRIYRQPQLHPECMPG